MLEDAFDIATLDCSTSVVPFDDPAAIAILADSYAIAVTPVEPTTPDVVAADGIDEAPEACLEESSRPWTEFESECGGDGADEVPDVLWD